MGGPKKKEEGEEDEEGKEENRLRKLVKKEMGRK